MSEDVGKLYAMLCDEELRRISLLKQKKNGNATPQARRAQQELARRNGVLKKHASRSDGSTKRYSHNESYMGFETDNR